MSQNAKTGVNTTYYRSHGSVIDCACWLSIRSMLLGINSIYMTVGRQIRTYICSRRLQRQPAHPELVGRDDRIFAKSTVLPQHARPAEGEAKNDPTDDIQNGDSEVAGQMSERLSQMTHESTQQGGRSAKRAIEEAGFSEELKRRLEARIQETSFKSENAATFAELNLPVCLLQYQTED